MSDKVFKNYQEIFFNFEVAKKDQEQLIKHWLELNHIKEWVHGQGLSNILVDLENFLNCKKSIFKHWITYDQKEKVPFAYLLTNESNEETVTIDFFIGEKNYLGKGFAVLIIKKFILENFNHKKFVTIDPEKANSKAIHIYEKIGFKIINEFIANWHPVPHLNMRLEVEKLKKYININITKTIEPKERMQKVVLESPNPKWPILFKESSDEIREILQNNCLEIYHIGSTAIPSIYAKPIIDIMPVVKDINAVDKLKLKFESLGYICMGEYGITGRRFFWRSIEKRTHNVHLFEEGSPEILRHVAFRDFMIKNDEYARSYSLLKCALAEVFSQDIENYVNGKSSFVQMINYKTGNAKKSQLEASDRVIIEPYNESWEKIAHAEIKIIKELSKHLKFNSIDHVGSTAVPGLASKPIIDIFITLSSIQEASAFIPILENLGYVFWKENPEKDHLRFFKGMPPYGEKRTHHVHIIEEKLNEVPHHRILFRDILRNDEKIRKDYELLKFKLAKISNQDREIYTEMKSEFIKTVLQSSGYKGEIRR